MFVLILNSSNIVQDGQNNKLIYKFPNSVNLTGKYIAVSSISMYYSWFNITLSYQNNTLSYTYNNTTVYTIVIPDGLYQMADINNLIQFNCIQNGTYYTIGNVNYYPFEFLINPNRYAVQLNTYYLPTSAPTGATTPSNFVGWATTARNPIVSIPNYFNNYIGYIPINNVIFSSNANIGGGTVFPTPSAATYYATINSSNTISYLSNSYPNIQPNSSIIFSLSNINNPYSQPSSIIYSISPSVAIGALIIERPPNFMWNKMIDGTYNQLQLNILGTNLYPITLNDPTMTIILTIRDKDEAYLGTK